MPITEEGGKLRVAAHVNGQDAIFIFDTGSETTVITEQAAGRLGLRAIAPDHGFGGRGELIGVGGARRARPMEARSVDLGGLRAQQFGFLVSDIPLKSDGFLSSDLISKYDIDLDLPGKRVRLFYPRGDCSHPSAFLKGTLFSAPLLANSRDRGPRLKITVNGVPVTALLDTGASSTAVFRAGAARLGIDVTGLGQAQATARGIGAGRVREGRAMLQNVAIGDLALDRLPARVLDQPSIGEDMLLGADFLAAVHVWISFSSGTLIMQVPPEPSPTTGSE